MELDRAVRTRRGGWLAAGLAAVLALVAFGAAPADAATTGTATVTVRATTAGGVPIPDAAIRLTAPDGSATPGILADSTGADGTVTFTDVPLGSYRVWGEVDFDASDRDADRALTVAGDTSVSLAVPGVQAITGTVTDAATRAPVAGAYVLAEATHATEDYTNYAGAQTSATGTYALIVLPDSYRVSASTAHASPVYYRNTDRTLATLSVVWDKDRTGIDLAVAADSVVTGKVTGQGKAVRGATVDLPPISESTTSSSGVFTTKVQPGAFTARVSTPASRGFLTTYSGGTVRAPDARPFTTYSGATTRLDVALVASAALTGKVVTASGKPLRNVSVAATNGDRTGSAQAMTDKHGVYVLRGLATGKVHVTFARLDRKIPSATVSVKQGTTTRLTTRVAAWSPFVVVTGKVTGRAVDDQAVELISSSHRVVASATPDRSGRVTFSLVPAGTYHVVVVGTNLSKKVVVTAGKQASFGTIARGTLHKISGVVRSASGAPVVGATVTITDASGTRTDPAETDAHGRFSVVGVVTGTYTVRAKSRSTADGTATVKVLVHRGKDRTGVSVRLPRAATLQGVVRNSHGKVVAGITVKVDGRTTTTDARGRWVLHGVTPGTRTVAFTDRYTGGYHSTSRTVKGTAAKTTTMSTVHVH